jgi:hypothetical protein
VQTSHPEFAASDIWRNITREVVVTYDSLVGDLRGSGIRLASGYADRLERMMEDLGLAK